MVKRSGNLRHGRQQQAKQCLGGWVESWHFVKNRNERGTLRPSIISCPGQPGSDSECAERLPRLDASLVDVLGHAATGETSFFLWPIRTLLISPTVAPATLPRSIEAFGRDASGERVESMRRGWFQTFHSDNRGLERSTARQRHWFSLRVSCKAFFAASHKP